MSLQTHLPLNNHYFSYMKKILFSLLVIIPLMTFGKHQIKVPNVKSLQASVNGDWTKLPVMELGSRDVLTVSFDELSHNYHRFIVHVEHCEFDWTTSDGLFESDWLQGFNDWQIDDYENSLNTNVLYTNYRFQIPNDMCRLKLSGNYIIHILDEDSDNEEVACVELRVVEPIASVSVGVSANTDIDMNRSHQQVSMGVRLNGLSVINHKEQLKTIVMQNGYEGDMRSEVMPNIITANEMRWEHRRDYIFNGGNEYHRFEVLDPTHITLGLEKVFWDDDECRFHVYPDKCEPQRNYLFYRDANGAFLVRNSDNVENDRISDYVYVHYKFAPIKNYTDATVFIDGRWTNEDADTYVMTYDDSDHSYNATILQKLGYYNYRIMISSRNEPTSLLPEEDTNSTSVSRLPEEGNFYETENSYQAFVYYKETAGRTWRLVGYKEVSFQAN